MPKILLIASAASHFENFHIPYIKALAERGNEIFTASRGAFSNESVSRHTELDFRKKFFHPLNIAVILKLAKIMRREKFDIICTNSTLAGFAGRFALMLSRRSETRSVHISHGYLFSDDGSFHCKTYLFFEKLTRKRTDVLAVMNKDDLDIARKYSLGKKIVFINGMGLDTDKFPEVSGDEIADFKSSLSLKENETVFLCAGEFSPRKSQKIVINACSLMKRDDFRVIFAGEGELLESCKAYAARLGVSEKIIFTGQFKNMNLLYRCCDCLISASEYEGLPFNVMEALFCGLEIIASDVKGNREFPAKLYPYADAKALCGLMEKQRPIRGAAVCRLEKKYFLAECKDNILKLFCPNQ